MIKDHLIFNFYILLQACNEIAHVGTESTGSLLALVVINNLRYRAENQVALLTERDESEMSVISKQYKQATTCAYLGREGLEDALVSFSAHQLDLHGGPDEGGEAVHQATVHVNTRIFQLVVVGNRRIRRVSRIRFTLIRHSVEEREREKKKKRTAKECGGLW